MKKIFRSPFKKASGGIKSFFGRGRRRLLKTIKLYFRFEPSINDNGYLISCLKVPKLQYYEEY